VTVPIAAYVILSAILFTLGAVGVLIRRNTLIMFMSIELMLNAVGLALVAFALLHAQMGGQLVVLFVLVVAAVEVVVGLAIIIDIFRSRDTVDVDEIDLLRG
jgi:NADH-quinone oxidoreductase subunit K